MDKFSYKRLFELCSKPNADLDLITQQFAAIFAEQNLFNILDHEYAYALFKVNSELYSMETYFRNADALITSAYLLNNSNFELALDTYEFLRMYDFTARYTDNTAAHSARMERLNSLRNATLTAVDVYLPNVYDAFQYQPASDPIWSCKNLSFIKPINVGDMSICTESELYDRFHAFTFDLLRDFVKQPFAANVLCCGGSIAKLIYPFSDISTLRQTDLDLFIFAKNYEERSNVLCEVLKYFEKYDAYYAIVSSVVSVYLKGIKRKFQIISINASNVNEILTRFDFTHVQIGIVFNKGKMRVIATHGAIVAHRSRCTRIHNTTRLRNQRLIKSLMSGFHIQKHSSIDDEQFVELISGDITDPLANLTKLMVELSKYYYPPQHIDDELNVVSMIQADARTDIVLRSSQRVMDNITISGSFEGGYETYSYKEFKLTHIKSKHVVARRCTIVIATMTGEVKILSDTLKLVERKLNDDELILKFSCSVKFMTFITETLETKLWRIFTSKKINTFNVVDSLLVVKLNNNMLQGKRSKFQDQRGKPLNYEDIADNDEIQMMFRIAITIDVANVSGVVIKPICFIKMCKYVEQNIEGAPDLDVKHPPELNWIV